jgi:hypothetical protein
MTWVIFTRMNYYNPLTSIINTANLRILVYPKTLINPFFLTKILYLFLLCLSMPSTTYAQCNLAPPTTQSVIQCGPGSTTLQAMGAGGTIAWYNDSGSLNSIGIGSSFLTPFLTESETYYAAVTTTTLSTWDFSTDLQGWTAATQCDLNTVNWVWNSDGGQGTAFAQSLSENSSLFLSSPVIDAAGATAIDFDFIHRFNTETCCDHGYAVYRLDGGDWQRFVPTTGPYNIFDFMYNDPFLGDCGFSPDIDVFAGDNGGYQESGGLLSVMGASTVEVGFLFTSDASFADEGWYINEVSVEVICESPRVQVDVTVTPLQDAPTTVSASTCGGSSATVSVSSNTNNPAPAFQWFDDVSGGNMLGSGSTFTASPSETTTYWVEELPGGTQLDQSWTFDTDNEGWTLATQCGLPFNWEWNSDANRGALLANNPTGGNTSMLAISPVVNVSSFEEVFFSYNHRFNTETCCDHGYVVYRLDGGPWEVFQAGDYPVFDFMYNDPILGACGFSPDTTVYAGESGGYFASGGLLDVSGGTNLEVAFLYTSDASFVDEGWYINSVNLISASNCPSERTAATIFISDAPPAPTVENQDQCPGLTTTLTAQSNSGLPNPSFEWYDAPAGGNLLASGPAYQFEPVGPTTIYVQELAQSFQQWSFDSDFEGWTATATCGLTENWIWNSDGGQGALFAGNPGGGNTSMLLQSPAVMVSGSEEVQLNYSHRFNTETCCDHGYVVYRLDGGPWEVFQAGDYPMVDFMYNDPILGACGNSPDTTVYAGDSGGYISSSAAISTSGAQFLEVAFLFTSDASFTDEGWYINEVTIDGVAQADCSSPRVPLAINFPDLMAPLVNDAEVCPPQSPVLTAITTSGTTNSQFEWYDAPVGGNLLYAGNPFIPNPIPLSNTSFYVEEVITGQRVWSFEEDLEGWSTNGECGFSDTWQWIDEDGEGALFARQAESGNSSIFLQSPAVDVSSDEGAVQLSYRHRYNTEACCDHGYVAYRLDGGPWEVFQAGDYPIVDFMYNDPILGACGNSPDTTVYAGDSDGYLLSSGSINVGGAASLEVGFLYTSDGSFVDDAWYLSEVVIDDIKSACVGPRSEAQVLLTGGLPDPTVEDIAACPNENLDLTAMSNSGLLNPLFAWYDSPVAGNLLFTGNPYPIVTGGLATYYVEEFTTSDGFWTFDEDLEGWSANAQCDLLGNGNWEAVDDAGTSALFAQQNGSGNSSMFLESPIFALDGQVSIDYSFRHRFNTETCCDHGYVLTSIDGGPWVQITPTTNTYNEFDFMYNDPFQGDCSNSPDIDVYAGDSGGYLTSDGSISVIGATTLQIGFLYTSDASFVDEGWYIDEVLIEDIYPGCRSERVALNILDQGDIPILLDCPGDVLTSNDMGLCNALADLIPPTAIDGCGGPPLVVTGTRSDGMALNQPFPVGMTTVEWSATDADANTASCNTTVVVLDAENPMASCNNPNVALGTDGTADLTTALIDNSSQDNCGITDWALDINQVDCADIGPPIPVTLTITDAAGNTQSCIALVTVVDDLPPKAICQDIDLPLQADNTATLLPQQVDNGSIDNCGTVTLSVSPDQFTCADIGANIVTLTVQDNNGNMATCQVTVTVVEGAGDCNVPPVAICQNITRVADDNSMVMVIPEEVDNGSFDPDGDNITFSLTPPGPYGLGITVVTLKVTDPAGEEDICVANIEVLDASQIPTLSQWSIMILALSFLIIGTIALRQPVVRVA